MTWNDATWEADGGAAGGRCALSGNTRLHAHLLGGQGGLDRGDLTASAILSTIFFLLVAGLCYQYLRHRYVIIIPATIAVLGLALAFAIRAGMVGKGAQRMPRPATQAEQELLFIAQLLLIVVHVDLSKTMLHRAALDSRPSHFAYASYAVVTLCFILDTVAVSKLPTPANSHTPSRQYTDLRIAGASIAFFWVLGHALWLSFEKARMPLLPLGDLGVLILVAWFLVVPAFYSFVVTVVNNDGAGLTCSTTFFYVAFGLFNFLACVPLLVIAFVNFGLNGERDLQVALNNRLEADFQDEREALAEAEAELIEAAYAEDDERRRLADEKGFRLDF